MRRTLRMAVEPSAADVMTVPAVEVDHEATHAEIVGLLAAHGISALPVVDEGGGLVGIVTEHDLLHKAWPPAPDHTARRLMSSPVHTVGPDTSLAEVARVMRDRHIKRLPVVEDGRLVGILSRGDLLRAYLRDELTRDELLRRILGVTGAGDPDADAGEEPQSVVGGGGEVDILLALIMEQRPPLP